MRKLLIVLVVVAFSLGGCALLRDENLGYIYRAEDVEIYVGGRGSAWTAVVDQVDEMNAPPLTVSNSPNARIRVTTRRGSAP